MRHQAMPGRSAHRACKPACESWETNRDPVETVDLYIHYPPYLFISLGDGENAIESIFGNRIKTVEEVGSSLTNRATGPYLSRLVEVKNFRWTAEVEN